MHGVLVIPWQQGSMELHWEHGRSCGNRELDDIYVPTWPADDDELTKISRSMGDDDVWRLRSFTTTAPQPHNDDDTRSYVCI
jgi:hypothetical protein